MTLTVQQMIDTILKSIPGAPYSETVDTLKSGDPSQPVKGIVTTFLASCEILQKAVDLGANVVITHEPTFYNHLDNTDWLEDDSVYRAKRKLIEDHQLVVWRFHDYWHSHQPDGIMTGVLRALDWEAQAYSEWRNKVKVPTMSLRELVDYLKTKLGISTVRVIGAPDFQCSKIGLMVGSPPSEWQMRLLADDIDVLVAGEINEWETPEYVRDAIYQSQHKALVVIGHAVSEEAGMAYLVEWLRERFAEIPITHVPTSDPFRVE